MEAGGPWRTRVLITGTTVPWRPCSSALPESLSVQRPGSLCAGAAQIGKLMLRQIDSKLEDLADKAAGCPRDCHEDGDGAGSDRKPVRCI